MCGGTRAPGEIAGRQNGLSPRVRGNPTFVLLLRAAYRSIPACAGEPAPVRADLLGRGVYPRVCGGTERPPAMPACARGLSPRVRGNHRRQECQRHPGRSIPACAGEPGRACHTPTSRGVYPRVCGGTAGRIYAALHDAGLSPRVRGNHATPDRQGADEGSIPACAGEPVEGALADCAGQVYPRVCGGTTERCRNCHAGRGLSPRVRGNPTARSAARFQRPSIPACAGEPFRVATSTSARSVYPRVCGGTTGPRS